MEAGGKMMDKAKLANSTVWGLSYELYYASESDHKDIDPFLADKIVTVQNITEAMGGLTRAKMEFLPLTKAKVDKLINESYIKGECIDRYALSELAKWLSVSTKQLVTNYWLNDTNARWYTYPKTIIPEIFGEDKSIQIPIITKLVNLYGSTKNSYLVNAVGILFKDVHIDNLDTSCKIISTSTPLMKSVFLKRDDIKERYVLKGLKSLSKLTTQKDVNTKIDFKMLAKLGPSSRLKAMQQLLGMFDRYYQNMMYYKTRYPNDEYYRKRYEASFEQFGKQEIPFTTIPTKEEVAAFLFPCSIKYNDKVSELISKYEALLKLIARKPAEGGK